MTVQSLLDSGYKAYPAHLKEYADKLYQKCIYDENGKKKYFINIHHYPPESYSNGTGFSETFEAEVCCDSGNLRFSQHWIDSLKQVENNCEVFWKAFGSKYYEG